MRAFGLFIRRGWSLVHIVPSSATQVVSAVDDVAQGFDVQFGAFVFDVLYDVFVVHRASRGGYLGDVFVGCFFEEAVWPEPDFPGWYHVREVWRVKVKGGCVCGMFIRMRILLVAVGRR
jgi:hypothetical protein